MKYLTSFLFTSGMCNLLNWMAGLILILLGLITIGDGLLAFQATPTSEPTVMDAFARLPNWFGWLFIWFGFDTFFNGKLTTLVFNKILKPVLDPVVKTAVGEKRIEKLRERFNPSVRRRLWVRKTYSNVVDEEAQADLILLAELKLEHPELFDYLYHETSDKLRYRGITMDMIEAVAKYTESE